MTPADLEAAALALSGAELAVQWGDDRVYKLAGRMFAATDGTGRRLSFKASDVAFEALTGSGRAVPAPYLARAKWVSFADAGELDGAEVAGWLASAHGLVAAKLTGAQRRDLGLQP